MGACREGANIWICLTKRYPNGDWMGDRLFKKEFWRNSYLWHDSFGRYWNWLIGCRIKGHKNVQLLSDGGCHGDGSPVHHCFACEREVGLCEKVVDD